MKINILALLTAMLCFSIEIQAQNKSTLNFGKVSLSDFSLTNVKVDTSFGAVILADVGKSIFKGNKKGYFSIIYKHQRRVLVLNQKAFDIATVNIPLYKSKTSDDEETLEGLKASTYNIVDGKVEETKLDKDNVFKEVVDKNRTIRKFTLPAVKEGSIIEYSYTIESDFLFNLQPWSFQGGYPRLWSEYELILPEFFEYVFLSKGYHPFHIKEVKEKFESFMIRQEGVALGNGGKGSDQIFSLSSNSTISRWVMKDVPGIKEESFTSSIDNHLSKIEFQQSARKFPDMPRKDVLGSWVSLSAEMMKDPTFGAELKSENKWLEETLQNLELDGKDSLMKAKIIYNYIKNNFSSLGNKGLYTSQSLRETFKAKKGYVSDLNLMLTLMLNKAGLYAEPVILSTRSHGLPTDTYPLINQYNYVISKFKIGNQKYYLDASSRSLGFGKLHTYCYNGAAVGINFYTTQEELYPSYNSEKKLTNVVMINGDKNKWTGSFSSYLGYAESTNIREEVAEKGKDAFAEKIKKSYTGEYTASDVKMDDLEETEKVIKMNYMLELDRGEDDNSIIYFNPMLKEGLKQNYFQSMERNYPVELPFKMDETFLFQIEIPEGYVVDELPKSVKVSLNASDGSFEYIISKSPTVVVLRTRLNIENTLFMPEDYETLREFFDFVVKKHAEQIVFKKK